MGRGRAREDRRPGGEDGPVEPGRRVVALRPVTVRRVPTVGHPVRRRCARAGSATWSRHASGVPSPGPAACRRRWRAGASTLAARPRPSRTRRLRWPPSDRPDLMGQVVQRDVRRALAVDGQHQVRERVLDMAVAAVLGDQHVRAANSRSSGGTTAWKARSHPPSAVPGGRATLTAVPCGVRAAGVVREAGAGEQHLAGLVQGDRQHPRVVVEDLLDPVAVVHVDVDVGDPVRALVEQPRCRPRRRCRCRSRSPARASRDAARRRCWRCAALAGPHLAAGLDAWRRPRGQPHRACPRTPGCPRFRARDRRLVVRRSCRRA